jgi:hypothetical protein
MRSCLFAVILTIDAVLHVAEDILVAMKRGLFVETAERHGCSANNRNLCPQNGALSLPTVLIIAAPEALPVPRPRILRATQGMKQKRRGYLALLRIKDQLPPPQSL